MSADVTVKLGGESQGAQAAIAQTDERLRGLMGAAESSTSTTDAMSESWGRQSSALQRASVLMTGVSSGIHVLGSGMRALQASTQAYFQGAGRPDLWQEIETQIRGIKGSLFEMLIGTDDAAEGAERLQRILEVVSRVVGGLTDIFGPLVRIVGGAFVHAFDAAADAMEWLTGRSSDAEDALASLREEMERGAQEAQDADARIRSFTDAMLGETEAGIVAQRRQQIQDAAMDMAELGARALQTAGEMGTSQEQTAHLGAQIRDILNSGDLERPLTLMNEWTTSTGDTMRSIHETSLTVEDVFARVGTASGMTIDAFREAYASIDELSGGVYELGAAEEEGVGHTTNLTESILDLFDAATKAKDELLALQEASRADYDAAVESRRNQAEKLLDAEASRLEREEQMRADALDRWRAMQEAELARTQDLMNQYAAAFEVGGATIGNAITAGLEGTGKDGFNAFFGDSAHMAAQWARKVAAPMAIVNPVGAGFMVAGSIGLDVFASSLGRGGGGSSVESGFSGGGSPQVVNQSSTSYAVNFSGIVGDPRGVARQLVELSNLASREGIQ